jgi:hypothetical protein
MNSKVTKNELKAVEVCLREWRNPVEFGSIVYELDERMPNKQFQKQTGLSFLREAIIGVDFAKALGCEFVRLCEGNWPDFETSKGGVKKVYELVEAMENRKRGDEDWDSKELKLVPLSEWRKRAELIPDALCKVVKKKGDKDYPANKSGLVIYLNISTFGFMRKEVEANFHATTELAKDKFNEVWIVWGIKHYLLWLEGKASREVFQAPLNQRAYG